MIVRAIEPGDQTAWRTLWDGYNAFYGRSGPTALADGITQATWSRFFDASEPVNALVAEVQGSLAGLAHFIFHRSTTRMHDVCYLQDLFTAQAHRGKGVGRALVEAVYARAKEEGSSRVYWQTKADNQAARALYDKLARHHGFIVYTAEMDELP